MDSDTGTGEAAPPVTAPDTEALVREGRELFHCGNYLKAIELLDRVLAADPANVRALILKGRAFAERGTYSEAMVYLKKAIELEPANAEAWFHRGVTEQHMGRYAEADEAYSKAVSLNPEYSKVWAAKGAALLKIGKYDLAIESYDQALAIDPENTILQQERKLATMLHNFRVKAETEVQAVKAEASRAISASEDAGKNIRDKVIAPIGGAISGIVAKLGKGKKE
jgi:tetratricopeptide (TPR) repeat protein